MDAYLFMCQYDTLLISDGLSVSCNINRASLPRCIFPPRISTVRIYFLYTLESPSPAVKTQHKIKICSYFYWVTLHLYINLNNTDIL